MEGQRQSSDLLLPLSLVCVTLTDLFSVEEDEILRGTSLLVS